MARINSDLCQVELCQLGEAFTAKTNAHLCRLRSLLQSLTEIPVGTRAQHSKFLSPDVIDDTYRTRARALNEVAKQRGQSLALLALQWVLRRPEVTSALIGASSTWQLDHNIKTLEFPALSADELALIDQYGAHGTALNL